MRIVFLAAVLALTACGAHRRAAPGCTLGRGPEVSAETGEHPVALTTSCAVDSAPQVELFGQHGRPLDFTYVEEGGPKGTHTVLLDKYRCDIRSQDQAGTVDLDGARLGIGRSLLDWCPEEGVSTVIRVYLGGRHARPTWHDVLQDVYDGHLNSVWPCGALRTAIAHLPASPPIFSAIPGQLAQAAATACDAAVAEIARGAPRAAVDEALGSPSFGGPRCPVWRWQPEGGSTDGARVCFTIGRATVVQQALHL